jgi:DegV family protein with EDD domain
MPKPIRIVTDSSAHFLDPSFVQRHNITVVPLGIHFPSRRYREGIDIDTEVFFRRAAEAKTVPDLVAPSTEQFADIYDRLSAETDQILSIHISKAMHNTWQNARIASGSLLGRCQIEVLDSQTTSVGLAMIVEAAAKLAQTNDSLPDLVRMVRKLVPRVYSVFYVESLDYMRKWGLLSEGQSILGAMLSIKPFLTIEEGELTTMEKVRTRPQAIDKLVEFVTEFGLVERLVILQNTPYPTEQTKMLQERLISEFAQRNFPLVMYNPSLACYLGPDAMGIVIYESDSEDTKDRP